MGFSINLSTSLDHNFNVNPAVRLNGYVLSREGRVRVIGDYRDKVSSLINIGLKYGSLPPAFILGHIAVFEHSAAANHGQLSKSDFAVAQNISAYRELLATQ